MSRCSILCYLLEQMQTQRNSLKQNSCASMLCPDTRSFATQWNKCQRRANVFETQELWQCAMSRCYLMEQMQTQSNSFRRREFVTLCYVQMLNNLLPNGEKNANTEQFSSEQRNGDSTLCPEAQSFTTYLMEQCQNRDIPLETEQFLQYATSTCPLFSRIESFLKLLR